MKITKAQLQKIKITTDNLLKKMEDTDKKEYRKIVKDELKSFLGVFSDRVKKLDKVDKEFDKAGVARELNRFLEEFSKKIDGINNFQKEVYSLSNAVNKLGDVKPSAINFDKVINSIEKLGGSFPKGTEDRTDELIKAIKSIKVGKTKIEFPDEINVGNFPPRLTPQPVTNININGLRGPIKSSAKEVGGSVALLPDEPLENRRTIVLYNNSSGTLWIGGSMVTSATGLPVFGNSYSNPFDLSDRVSLYGISGSGSLDIRIFEASMDEIGA